MKFAVPSTIALSIIVALAYFSAPKPAKPPVIAVIAAASVAPVAPVAPAPVEVKQPEPFAYAEAVIPSFVPTPKARPHRRHRLACK